MEEINDHNLANEKKWNRRSVNFDSKRFSYFRLLQRELIKLIEFSPPTNFLDLGCGTGWAVFHVAKLMHEKGKFKGIDISEGMIEKAKSKINGLHNIDFYKANSESLPFEDNIFDNIICTNSFHHYLNPENALNEAKRVLKNYGKLYILDVTSDDFFIRWINRKVKIHEKEHVKFYSTKEYDNMFIHVGLKHVKSNLLKIFYPIKIHIAVKEN